MAHGDPLDPLLNPVRDAIVNQVRAAFNHGKVPETRIPPSDEALFAKDSPIRMVHADVMGMMIGGIRGLFLQMLHPAALQGVLDYSNFREDAQGRFHRTAQFISVTTFGHRDRAQEAIARVNKIHRKITGTLPDGTPYAASDPRTAAWVHIAEASSFLAGYLRHARPGMPHAEQDEYYAQMAVIGRALGADPVPTSVAEAEAIRRRRSGFSGHEQERLARGQRLLRVSADTAATPQERERAYRLARRELDGLIVLPERARAALERGISGELGT